MLQEFTHAALFGEDEELKLAEPRTVSVFESNKKSLLLLEGPVLGWTAARKAVKVHAATDFTACIDQLVAEGLLLKKEVRAVRTKKQVKHC